MAWPLIPLAPLTKATLGAVGYTETNSEDMVYRWFIDVQFGLVGIWHAHLRNGRVDFNKKNSFEYSGEFRVPLSTMTAEILLRDNSDQSRNTAPVLGQGEPCHCTQENYTFSGIHLSDLSVAKGTSNRSMWGSIPAIKPSAG